jgi:serine/threonine protein kinase
VAQPITIPGYFEIFGELGRGTTGAVYEARDMRLRLDRRIALLIPVIFSDAERPAKNERFRMMCQALAWLTAQPGSGIPALLEVGEHHGLPCSVRELINGSTLEQRSVERSIEMRMGLGIIARVARIMQFVHGKGFAHRNLSPANVLVATDGTPWLIGFGRVGLLAGSEFLAPGATGVPPEIDVQGLQELLRWLCATLGQPVPAALEKVRQPGSVASPGAFHDAIMSYLQEPPA